MSETSDRFEALTFAEAQAAFSKQALFENKTWRYAPEAFPLSPEQVVTIRKIGQACYDFYRAQELLYPAIRHR
jgi:hypothetical protein